jgi:GLPGLI family protein
MKKIFLAYLISFPWILVAQDTKVVKYTISYDFIPVTDTLNGTLGGPFEFLLLHADGESRFHASNKQFNDSMAYAYTLANPQFANPKTQEEAQEAIGHYSEKMRNWEKKVVVNYLVRKDFGAKKIQNELTFAFPPQHLEEPLNFSWDIGEKKDTIAGLSCYNAYTTYGGRKYTAWFSPDVPIPDGPYVFGGLPGLIVEISDEKGWFTFRLKSISVSPHQRFWKVNYINPQSKAISRKSYVDQSIKQKNNPRMPADVEASEELLLAMKERRKQSYYLLLESY